MAVAFAVFPIAFIFRATRVGDDALPIIFAVGKTAFILRTISEGEDALSIVFAVGKTAFILRAISVGEDTELSTPRFTGIDNTLWLFLLTNAVVPMSGIGLANGKFALSKRKSRCDSQR